MVACKPKPCQMCSLEFTPTGHCQKRCTSCRESYSQTPEWKARSKVMADKYRIKKYAREGRQFGVGIGKAHGKGPSHPTYKTGIGTFRQFRKDVCDRCPSTKFLCVHHKDQNRYNNVPENLETLCKRCHQLEHDCYASLPKGEALSQIMSERAKRLTPLRTRNSKGQFTNDKTDK